MKKNNWIAAAVCIGAGFLAGFAAAMALFGRKKKKADTKQTMEDMTAEAAGMTEEEVHDE
ncbi:MAG TPA: hypothetical protein H9674_01275 [Firmicutes bacterium]|nr:hypothetical protein [Bacillota bacterium]